MKAAVIGISSGILIIILIMLKRFDKKLVYGFILTGIGFLYIGFAWSDKRDFIINAIQALVFLNIAYYGTQRNIYLLAAGFFLHGCWDIAYGFFGHKALIPLHYDIFCSTLDFVIGLYILVFKKQFVIESRKAGV